MDGELVTDLPSDNKGSGRKSAPLLSYSDFFHQVCPQYMLYGMTYDEFWDGTPDMARAFRKAYKLKLQAHNQDMWLQGLYFYDALCSASPAFRDMIKNCKPFPYLEAPYPLTKHEVKEREDEKAKADFERMKRTMMAKMANINRKFEKQRK